MESKKINSKDLREIKDFALNFIREKPHKVDISKEEFKTEQIALIEATILFLNKNNMLNKLPVFDYTERILESIDDSN